MKILIRAAVAAIAGVAVMALSGPAFAAINPRLTLYPPAKGSRTGTNQYGFEASVVGGKITSVEDGVGNMAIPSNGYVISGHGDARTWLRTYAKVGYLSAISGTTLTITKQ